MRLLYAPRERSYGLAFDEATNHWRSWRLLGVTTAARYTPSSNRKSGADQSDHGADLVDR